MKVLVVGLGSMGNRRIRNLKSLGVSHIIGFDTNSGRAENVKSTMDIELIQSVQEFYELLVNRSVDAVVISTSPAFHMDYAEPCVSSGIPVFIEASVTDTERVGKLSVDAEAAGVLVAPSCTMQFFTGPKLLKELIGQAVIGKVISISYQTGQWLEDWHPWESIEDYYVSQHATGGCREIVPFELTWINELFGSPKLLSATKAKLSNMKASIDDYYSFHLVYPDEIHASFVVEVLSQPLNTREMRIIGETGIIVYSSDSNEVRYVNKDSEGWVSFDLDSGTHFNGSINPDEPYEAELNTFLSAVNGGTKFPNSLANDFQVLTLLESIDALANEL